MADWGLYILPQKTSNCPWICGHKLRTYATWKLAWAIMGALMRSFTHSRRMQYVGTLPLENIYRKTLIPKRLLIYCTVAKKETKTDKGEGEEGDKFNRSLEI